MVEMATIRNRGEYQWEAQIRRKGYPAQRKTFETKSDAQAWARMIESEIDRGIFVSRVEAERTAFHQLIDRYISEIAPKHKGAYSEIKRLEALKRHPLATRIVATLTSSDFARYRDERLKIRKGNTVKRELALFQCVIEVARREWGIHLAENPVRMVSRPSYNDERSRRLDPIEEEYILNALELRERRADGTYADASHNPWIRPIVQLAIETAMRRGEIFELRWKHVNLDRRTAHLPATKNGLPRTVPLSPRAIQLLKDLPRSLCGRVFPTTADALKKAFTRGLERARTKYLGDCERALVPPQEDFLLDLRFHDLRHEATCRLATKLPNLIELASVTGHREVNMLKRYYNITAEELAAKLA
ncbi:MULTISPECIES: site-specific integrase [Pseudomonas]|uniref:site-specific integrase n=1 Tax=Pseudomonas TaxID=286 RepID=UPI001E55DD27|nr:MULTISPECIES: site-specific integrase [Pseudomonas]